MAVWYQNRQGALLQASFSRPSSLKKRHEQRYRKMWLPRILFSFMKPVHTFAFNFCFLLDIKHASHPTSLGIFSFPDFLLYLTKVSHIYSYSLTLLSPAIFHAIKLFRGVKGHTSGIHAKGRGKKMIDLMTWSV